MKVYIAAPFADAPFARLIAQGLRQLADIECTSRWLTGSSELNDEWARKDLEDIDAADVLVALNAEAWNDPAANKGSGGRHVEFGYALAMGKPILLVGSRSNIFHYHSDVLFVTWHDALNLPAIIIEALGDI